MHAVSFQVSRAKRAFSRACGPLGGDRHANSEFQIDHTCRTGIESVPVQLAFGSRNMHTCSLVHLHMYHSFVI